MFLRISIARRCAALRVAAPMVALAVATLSGQPATGRIVGRVRLVAADAGRPLTVGYTGRSITQPGQPGREIRNVVVYVQGLTGPAGAARQYEMRQQGETFAPRVLAISRGSTVTFPNADPYFHNVFSLSRAATFDLGRYPPGHSRLRTFTAAGLVKVFCHLHSHMSGSILVFDHPWFTLPADDGGFAIEGVPAGKQTLTAWHERIGEARTTVTVPAGGEATAEFELPVVEP